MAYVTKTVVVNPTWTQVTSAIAMLQFNDEMSMAITSGLTPSESDAGFHMEVNEKYVNGAAGVTVWARSLRGGTGRESVRVAEDV